MRRLATLVLTALGIAVVPFSTAQAAVWGVITVNLTIQLQTAVPAGGSVLCVASLTAADAGAVVSEEAAVTATGTSGTATCAVPIPYLWNLSTPNSDTVSVSYSTYILPSGGSIGLGVVRSSTHTLPSIVGVPSAGTHTDLSDSTKM